MTILSRHPAGPIPQKWYERPCPGFPFRLLFVLLLGLAPLGCSSEGGGPGRGLNSADRSVRDARAEFQPRSVDTSGQRPVVLVGNEGITWNELCRPLAEAAGAGIVEEVCLDRLLAREMQALALALDPDAIAREERLLIDALATTAGLDGERQGEVLQQVKRTRGLGDARYTALLRRNAMLRRMVRDEISVTPADIAQAHEIRYGARFQARLILTRTERDAVAAADRVRAGERFADVATAMSVDSSRLRGGFLGDISPADPAYPLALRRALIETPAGMPSKVIALEQGYALVLVEQVVPVSSTPLESVSAALEREIRLVRERAAMDRLANQLLRGTKITVLDPSLDWSWKNRGE